MPGFLPPHHPPSSGNFTSADPYTCYYCPPERPRPARQTIHLTDTLPSGFFTRKIVPLCWPCYRRLEFARWLMSHPDDRLRMSDWPHGVDHLVRAFEQPLATLTVPPVPPMPERTEAASSANDEPIPRSLVPPLAPHATRGHDAASPTRGHPLSSGLPRYTIPEDWTWQDIGAGFDNVDTTGAPPSDAPGPDALVDLAPGWERWEQQDIGRGAGSDEDEDREERSA